MAKLRIRLCRGHLFLYESKITFNKLWCTYYVLIWVIHSWLEEIQSSRVLITSFGFLATVKRLLWQYSWSFVAYFHLPILSPYLMKQMIFLISLGIHEVLVIFWLLVMSWHCGDFVLYLLVWLCKILKVSNILNFDINICFLFLLCMIQCDIGARRWQGANLLTQRLHRC